MAKGYSHDKRLILDSYSLEKFPGINLIKVVNSSVQTSTHCPVEASYF